MSKKIKVCVDCAQEVVEVKKDSIIDATLRNELVNTNCAFCEGCFKNVPVKYMCPFAHFMCEKCGNTDMGDDWKPSEIVDGLSKTYQFTIENMLKKNESNIKKI